MRLYEIDQELQQAIELMEQWAIDHEGDVSEFPLMDELGKLQLDIEHKALSIGCVIKGYWAEADAYTNEINGLKARKEAVMRRADSLEQYLLSAVEPGTKLADSRCKIGWRKSSTVELLVPPEDLPEQFRKVKMECSACKDEIKKAIKAGETVQGASLVEHQNIQIQ